MQTEAELDRLLAASLDSGYKIPDPRVLGDSQRPFDLFGVYQGHPAFIEGKFLPSPQAFNWSRLEDHQQEWLKTFDYPGFITCVIIGVQFKRGDIRCFVYPPDEFIYRKANKKSVLKKEFENDPLFVKVSKGKIDYSRVLEILDEKIKHPYPKEIEK